jgi:hypothetical protein
VDFVDLFTPGTMLTWRKLLVLLKFLPPEGALNTAMRNMMPEDELLREGDTSDPTKGRWSTIEMMLATLIDEVRMGNWVLVQVNSEKTVKRPEPIRRPGRSQSTRTSKRMSLEDAQRLDPRLRGKSAEEAQAMLDQIRGMN